MDEITNFDAMPVWNRFIIGPVSVKVDNCGPVEIDLSYGQRVQHAVQKALYLLKGVTAVAQQKDWEVSLDDTQHPPFLSVQSR